MSEGGGEPPPPGGIRVRARLSPPFRELLRAVVQRVQAAAATPPEPPGVTEKLIDPELLAALTEELRSGAAVEAGELAKLLARPDFGVADIFLEPAPAEAVIRGSVQVRLHLHETLLRDLSAGELDGGLEFFSLTPVEQQGYACYRLLIHLEENLLRQIDPGLAGGQ
jgi:hypothetical protein